MKRIYIPWDKWECYKNGMWSTSVGDKGSENNAIIKCIEFTGNHIIYGNAMIDV